MAGTKLWTPQGYRAIEEIKAGELVYSRDQWDAGGDVSAKVVEEVFNTGEWVPVYNLRIADYHAYFVGSEGWGFNVWAHNTYTYKLAANRLNYRLHSPGAMQRLVDAAIQYRLDHEELTGGRNVAVVACQAQGSSEVLFCVPSAAGSVHSEPLILAEVLRNGFASNDIIALYTERSPCRECRALLGPVASATSLGLCETKVYWSFDYDADRRRIGGYIDQTINALRG